MNHLSVALTDVLGSIGNMAEIGAEIGDGGGKGKKGGGASKNKVINAFVSLLEKVADEKQDAFFTTDQLREVFGRVGVPCPHANFQDLVDEINNNNSILKKGPRLYKLQSSRYAQRGYSQFSQVRGTQR